MSMVNALVAVSGGSDSLALLDILYTKKEYKLIVCHVNYNYRDSSTRDENLVRKYCNNKNIDCYVLNLESKKQKTGNFEDWARVARYKFFKEIYLKESCKCLFVGHQKEDVIETFLLQKKRNSIVETYGLARETNIQGMKVVRPLLNYTKKELEDYCVNNGIEYGVDETNFDLNYSRNRLRHQVIAKMSEEEKEKILKEIEDLNHTKQEHLKNIKNKIKECLIDKNRIDLENFKVLDYETKKEVLYYFLIDNVYKKISIRSSRLDDLIKKINSDKPNLMLATYDNLTLYKEYKILIIEENKQEYCYEISDSDSKELGNGFYISNKGAKLERVVIDESMFPLYLKNYDGSNKIVNRLFINKKVPLRYRKSWPVIVDKFGGLLLVIGIKKFYNETCDYDGNLVDFYICKNKGE